MTRRTISLVDKGDCPYFEGRTWRVEEYPVSILSAGQYEELLAYGFRRSGDIVYRNHCPGCSACLPLRLSAPVFAPNPSQRRTERKNRDLIVELSAAAFSEERYLLYRKYLEARHGREDLPEPLARMSYSAFLIDNPLGVSLVADYRLPSGRLAATGYLDELPGGFSSVYFAFDPEFSARSLGSFSVLKELALAAEKGKRHYYLGFWVPGSRKMDYKANYRPFELAIHGAWTPMAGREAALKALESA